MTGKGFRKGQSGNPGGRPRGLARMVRELPGLEDGEAIVRFWVAVMNDPRQKTEHRLLASKLLAERGWGKATVFVSIEEDDPLDFAARERETAELAAEFERALDKLAARKAAIARKAARAE